MRRIRLAHPGPRPGARGVAARRPRRTRRPSRAARRRAGLRDPRQAAGHARRARSSRSTPLAREEVKQIFGRETIKLLDRPTSWRDKVVATWGPSPPLRLVGPARVLGRPADHPGRLPAAEAADPGRAIQGGSRRSPSRPRPPAADAGRAQEARRGSRSLDRRRLDRVRPGSRKLSKRGPRRSRSLAAKLSEEHKWLSPARARRGPGAVGRPAYAVQDWFRDAHRQASGRRANADVSDQADRAREAGDRGRHAAGPLPGRQRDREVRSVEPLLIMPRPSNQGYLASSRKAIAKKYAKETWSRAVSPLELDAAQVARRPTGTTSRSTIARCPARTRSSTTEFADWLRGSSVWVPLDGPARFEARGAGGGRLPAEQVEAFRTAFKELEQAEAANPARSPRRRRRPCRRRPRAGRGGRTDAVIRLCAPDGSRDLLQRDQPVLQGPGRLRRRGLAFLAVSLGFLTIQQRGSPLWCGRGIDLCGRACSAWCSGIALEVVGFTLRVQITGWAPVTNMYETVIWVSLVSAVLGLVFELIYRQTFAALAGSGVALLGTVLAANVPLLDPSIKRLQPVLRSNYWLTIHVLTEVSSYAAFAPGLGLGHDRHGLLPDGDLPPLAAATCELALPLIPGCRCWRWARSGWRRLYGQFGLEWTPGRSALLLRLGGPGRLGEVAVDRRPRRAPGRGRSAGRPSATTPASTTRPIDGRDPAAPRHVGADGDRRRGRSGRWRP